MVFTAFAEMYDCLSSVYGHHIFACRIGPILIIPVPESGMCRTQAVIPFSFKSVVEIRSQSDVFKYTFANFVCIMIRIKTSSFCQLLIPGGIEIYEDQIK